MIGQDYIDSEDFADQQGILPPDGDGVDGPDGLDGLIPRVLETVRDWFARFVYPMHDLDLDLLVLWAAHTHLLDALYTTPRLVLDSPVPGSGKTTVLEHLQRLCLDPVQMATVSSPALITRMLDKGVRTILVDEADRSLRPDKPGVEDLIAVINSGYKRGGTRPVLVPDKENGWISREMPTYSPVVMAGNGPDLPDDTKSRTIRVLLLPDLEGNVEDSDWEEIEVEALFLGQQLALWADQVRDEVRHSRPDLPEGCRGRVKEKWGPMKRIAVAAGGRWPEIADRLIARDLEEIEQDKEDGMTIDRPAITLLRHLGELWEDGEPWMATEYLLQQLIFKYPEMWGAESSFGKPLTAQRFGRMLTSSYKIHSMKNAKGKRGYALASFTTAARRMGIPFTLGIKPSNPSGPSTPSQETLPIETVQSVPAVETVNKPPATQPPLPAVAPFRRAANRCDYADTKPGTHDGPTTVNGAGARVCATCGPHLFRKE